MMGGFFVVEGQAGVVARRTLGKGLCPGMRLSVVVLLFVCHCQHSSAADDLLLSKH